MRYSAPRRRSPQLGGIIYDQKKVNIEKSSPKKKIPMKSDRPKFVPGVKTSPKKKINPIKTSPKKIDPKKKFNPMKINPKNVNNEQALNECALCYESLLFTKHSLMCSECPHEGCAKHPMCDDCFGEMKASVRPGQGIKCPLCRYKCPAPDLFLPAELTSEIDIIKWFDERSIIKDYNEDVTRRVWEIDDKLQELWDSPTDTPTTAEEDEIWKIVWLYANIVRTVLDDGPGMKKTRDYISQTLKIHERKWASNPEVTPYQKKIPEKLAKLSMTLNQLINRCYEMSTKQLIYLGL